MALDADIDPKIVSDRIGHANMAYTLAIYTHPSTGKDRDAAGKVAGMIGWAAPSAAPHTSAPCPRTDLRAVRRRRGGNLWRARPGMIRG
jgi:hypothetical protein